MPLNPLDSRIDDQTWKLQTQQLHDIDEVRLVIATVPNAHSYLNVVLNETEHTVDDYGGVEVDGQDLDTTLDFADSYGIAPSTSSSK